MIFPEKEGPRNYKNQFSFSQRKQNPVWGPRPERLETCQAGPSHVDYSNCGEAEEIGTQTQWAYNSGQPDHESPLAPIGGIDLSSF